jgi:hypothetical protein
MGIREGNIFFGNRQFDEAIREYSETISKYANSTQHPCINFSEIVEALRNRGDAYAEKAKSPTKKQARLYALRAKDSYNMAITIGLQNQCIFTHFEACANGIELMNNII